MQITLDDLMRILRDSAGTHEGAGGAAELLDATFDDLGYDSLALLETAGRVEREYGVALDEEAVAGAQTPRALLNVVNAQLTAA